MGRKKSIETIEETKTEETVEVSETEASEEASETETPKAVRTATSEETAEVNAAATEEATEETVETATEAEEDEEAEEALDNDSLGDSKKPMKLKNLLLSFKGVYLYLAIAVAFLTVALAVVLVLPFNRSNRALRKADKAYALSEFETASVLYEKAFTINDDNLAAFYGYLLSESSKGGNAKDSYLKVFDNIKYIVGAKTSSNTLLDIYLLAPEMISDDYAKLIEVLETGAAQVAEGKALSNPLADAYFKLGMQTKDTDLDGALLLFDKVLELSDSAESMALDITDCVVHRISLYSGSDEFEKAKEMLEKYKDILPIDEASVRASIEALEAIYETKLSLLTNVYNAMEPYYTANKSTFEEGFPNETEPLFRAFNYDWTSMLQYDGSIDADTVALSDSAEAYLYSKEGMQANYSGIGCGLYPYGEIYTNADGTQRVPYYFYFGDFKNGKREGYGIVFIRTDATSYDVFEGTWVNDVPEGFGAYYNNNMYAYTSLAQIRMLSYGNYSAGLENGEMTVIAVLNEHPDVYFKGAYTAEGGRVQPLSGEPIEHGIVNDTPEGMDLIAVIGSTTDGYDYFVPMYLGQSSKLGLYGFE